MPLSYTERQKLQELRARKVAKAAHAIYSPVRYRTFVHIDDGHDKFWKIGRVGTSVLTQFGANGDSGFERRKAFGSVLSAITYIQSKIREKLGKGYQELV